MQKTVCLCLVSLFNSLKNDGWRIRLTYDLWLEKSMQDETEYYDLYSDSGLLVGCDGENYQILEETSNSIALLSEDADESFSLAKQEFNLANPI